MDMEKLTKQQIVLVTLLVSFVTSIATGIVTVALMDQAPPGVTQTINRVVEKTIEKVVMPPEGGNSAAVVTRETIVVKEDDKIVESVNKNKDSIVRIYTNTDNAGDVAGNTFIGLGTIVSKDGLIATGDIFADTRGKYLVTLDGSKFYNITVLPKGNENQLYFMKIIQDKKSPVEFTPVSFSDSNNLQLGQTVVAWGGQNQNSIFTGIVSSLRTAEAGSQPTATSTSSEIIGLNVSVNSTDSLAGGPLINLSGETVGLRLSSNLSLPFDFLPANIVKQEVAKYAAVQ